MCGLVSVLTKRSSGFSMGELKMFKNLLYVDGLRGLDSTGVFGVNKHGSVSVMKQATGPINFMETKMFDDWDGEMFQDGRFMVGHNRSATKGKVVDENAHPFTEGHITLVHNGTLNTHRELANTEVDSQAICKSIAERGYKETLAMVDGAFALIWYDMNVNKLFITRNTKRPLGMCWTPDKQSIYIASEVGMIPWIAARNNEKIDKLLYFNEDKDNVGTVFTVDLDTFAFEKEEVPFYKPKPYQKHLAGFVPAWYSEAGYDDDLKTYYAGLEKKEEEALKQIETTKVVSITSSDTKQPGGAVTPFGHSTSVGGATNFREIVSARTPRSELNKAHTWKGAKSVVFDYEDYMPDNTGFSMMGLFNNIAVDCYITTEEEMEKLNKYKNFIGDVEEVKFFNDQVLRIIVTNVRPWLYKFSKNGEMINADTWERIHNDLYCDDCGTEVGLNEIEDAVVRFDKNTGLPRRIVCGECINKKANLHKEATSK